MYIYSAIIFEAYNFNEQLHKKQNIYYWQHCLHAQHYLFVEVMLEMQILNSNIWQHETYSLIPVDSKNKAT